MNYGNKQIKRLLLEDAYNRKSGKYWFNLLFWRDIAKSWMELNSCWFNSMFKNAQAVAGVEQLSHLAKNQV